jgi:hypothetical protein
MINSENIFPVVAVGGGCAVMVSAALIIAFKPNPPDSVRDLIVGGGGVAALGGTAYGITYSQTNNRKPTTRKKATPPGP